MTDPLLTFCPEVRNSLADQQSMLSSKDNAFSMLASAQRFVLCIIWQPLPPWCSDTRDTERKVLSVDLPRDPCG